MYCLICTQPGRSVREGRGRAFAPGAFAPGAFAPGAFTLVELLVVIGIIALLISILLPALNNARQQAVQVKCLSQMKQLSNAFVMYVNENHGWMPSCDTCGPLYPQSFTSPIGTIFPTATSTATWVGWVDGTAVNQALMNGTLWKYINNVNIYKCPADNNIYRNRTYSMNSFLATGTATSPNGSGWPTVNAFTIYKMTQVGNATNTIAFVEEADPRNFGGATSPNTMINDWNLGGWFENPLICDTLPNQPEATVGYWDDLIASWHHGGANIAFVDGHAEYHRWTDPRTVNLYKNDPTWPSPRAYTPGDVDLTYVRKGVCTWSMQQTQ